VLDIYIDADACPVKDEVYRVARRWNLKVFVVCNSHLNVPKDESIQLVQVDTRDFNAADDWIAERVQADDIVITRDIPLADRCIKKGARVLGPTGRLLDEDSIGSAVATRDLMDQLRGMGAITGGGPPPMEKKDRAHFLAQLHQIIQAVRRDR